MRMTNKLICANFLVLFLSFFIFEILFIISIIFIYKGQLNSTTDAIPKSIFENSLEVLNSFNNLLKEEINEFGRDSLYISKHMALYKQSIPSLGKINPDSAFGKKDENCLVKDINTLKDNNDYKAYVEMFLTDQAKIINPISSLVKNHFGSNSDKLSSDELADKLFDLKSLNKISHYQDSDSLIDIKEICFAKMVFKTILIKHILKFRNNTYLNNIFIIDDKILFSYPLNNVNNNFLTKFTQFSCNTGSYSVKCAMNLLDEYSKEKNLPTHSIIFTNTNEKTNIWTCMKNQVKLFTSNHFYICLQHQLSAEIQCISDPSMQIVLFAIKNTDVIIFLIDSEKKEKYVEYFNSPYLNEKYSKIAKDLHLFHILYSDIFENAKNQLTLEKVQELEEEYKEISKQVIAAYEHISNGENKQETFKISATFLDDDYNISGELKKCKHLLYKIYLIIAELNKGDHVIALSPITHENYQYDNNFIHDDKTDKQYPLLCNMVIYKLIVDRINQRLFVVWVYKCIATWSFSTFLLLVYQWPFFIFFNCVLDGIFEPIREIDQKMEIKISSISSIYKDTYDQDNQKMKLNIEGKEKLNEDYKKFCQFFYFLENLSLMKMNLKTVLIDEHIMNEIFPSLNNNKDKIIYGSYVAEYFFRNSMYEKCRLTIKNFKAAIDDEMIRLKEETDNIEMEVHNVVSSYCYINDYSDLKMIFNGEAHASNKEYFMICATASKLYYIYGVSKLKIEYQKMKKEKEVQKKEKEKEKEKEKDKGKDKDKTKDKDNKINLAISKPKLFDKNKSILHYFDKSLELSEKLNCNKIKRIIIYIHRVKYYIMQGNYIDAFINVVEALTYFLELNDKIKIISKQINFDPIIMMIINSSIFEEIIYLSGKIKVKTSEFNETTIKNLSTSFALSFFKTDFIQGKACKLISIMIDKSIKLQEKNAFKKAYYNDDEKKKELEKRKNQQKFLTKVNKRLKNPELFKSRKKRLVLIFSEAFVDRLPSTIEFIEILASCISNHCNNNDIIRAYQFNQDFNEEYKIWTTTPKDFSKDKMAEILNQDKEPVPFGMFESLSKAFDFLNNTSESQSQWNNASHDYDDYIFQFILTRDFKFKYPEDRSNIRDALNDSENIISLYTFIFDYHLASEKKKYKIINNISKYAEGVLLNVVNFDIMKFAFHNISNKKSKTNLLNFNSSLVNNIYYFNNKTKEDLINKPRNKQEIEENQSMFNHSFQ